MRAWLEATGQVPFEKIAQRVSFPLAQADWQTAQAVGGQKTWEDLLLNFYLLRISRSGPRSRLPILAFAWAADPPRGFCLGGLDKCKLEPVSPLPLSCLVLPCLHQVCMSRPCPQPAQGPGTGTSTP